MNDIFLFRSSKVIIKKYLEHLAGSDRKGANQRLAMALGIFPSYLSLILNGERTLNLDQGVLLADYLKLRKEERRYLMRIIELERAQTQKLKDELNSEIDEMVKKDHQIANKIDKDKLDLNLDELVCFFSSWEYSSILLEPALSSGKVQISSLSRKYNLDQERIREIKNFLVKSGLWIKSNSNIELGKRKIHLGDESPLLNKHHSNWRLKAISRHPNMNRENELAYSLCVALSKNDVLKIKSILLQTIEELRMVSDPSDSEVVYNLNIDWLLV